MDINEVVDRYLTEDTLKKLMDKVSKNYHIKDGKGIISFSNGMSVEVEIDDDDWYVYTIRNSKNKSTESGSEEIKNTRELKDIIKNVGATRK